MRAFSTLQSDWGRLWPVAFAPVLLLPVLAFFGVARGEHFVILTAITFLALASRLTRDLLVAVVPGIVIALGYEGIRLLRPFFVTPERVWACELHRLDADLFGFGSGLAPSDHFATLNSTTADLFFGLPYTLFWGVVLAYCGVLFFMSRTRLRRYLWLLALTHGVAFLIWMILPAAPPWYVRAHGCLIDPSVLPSAAALSRLDTFFSIAYFETFYSRAPTIFGAMPSLHVSFPAVALVAGWRDFGPIGRVTTAAMTLWMLVASIYLDHHWLVDGMATLVIVCAGYLLLMRLSLSYRKQVR
jgi:inositol phosphorylceramide synthase catalytic subunit